VLVLQGECDPFGTPAEVAGLLRREVATLLP
jgi:hypothetical protein